ncbi:MAG: hypothetical protein G8D91_09200 [gamma proteobacterium symbiont of Clathrolucina costata]
MTTINIPPTFSDLEGLEDEDLRKLVRMSTAILNERAPVTPKSSVKKGAVAAAFEAIPSHPVDAEEFAESHGISVSALRQRYRFDPLKDSGAEVHVKKSKKDGRLYVWRGDATL